MSSLFDIRRLLRHGGMSVIGTVQTMCHVITNVTADHRPSSQTVRILPVRQFAKYPHPTISACEEASGDFKQWTVPIVRETSFCEARRYSSCARTVSNAMYNAIFRAQRVHSKQGGVWGRSQWGGGK